MLLSQSGDKKKYIFLKILVDAPVFIAYYKMLEAGGCLAVRLESGRYFFRLRAKSSFES